MVVKRRKITSAGILVILTTILIMGVVINLIHTQVLYNKSLKNIHNINSNIAITDSIQNRLNISTIEILSLKKQIKELKVEDIKAENAVEEISVVEEEETEISDNQLIGYFTVTHYDICELCCGKAPSHPEYGITSTGVVAKPNRTIAVDPKVIPYGTEVIINGEEYIAEDTGGAIKGYKIDICVESHSIALDKGRITNVPVYIKK